MVASPVMRSISRITRGTAGAKPGTARADASESEQAPARTAGRPSLTRPTTALPTSRPACPGHTSFPVPSRSVSRARAGFPFGSRPFVRLLLPSLEGSGWGWVGFRITARLRPKLANPPPAPPFLGGEKLSQAIRSGTSAASSAIAAAGATASQGNTNQSFVTVRSITRAL